MEQLERIEAIRTLRTEAALKLLYQWVKTDVICCRDFVQLLGHVDLE